MPTLPRMWPYTNCAAAVAQLPWGHLMVLLDRLDDPDVRVWNAARAVADGWSRGGCKRSAQRATRRAELRGPWRGDVSAPTLAVACHDDSHVPGSREAWLQRHR